MQKSINKQLSKDRVVCENYYGRLLNLFGLMRQRFTYEHDKYDKCFVFCAALTNYHLPQNPLTGNDGQYYRSFIKSRIEEANEREKKKTESRQKYLSKMNQRKKRRLDHTETLLQ
jgi:hypothetical protein